MNFSLLPFITPGGTGEEAPPAPPQPPPQPQPADSVNSKPLLQPCNCIHACSDVWDPDTCSTTCTDLQQLSRPWMCQHLLVTV